MRVPAPQRARHVRMDAISDAAALLGLTDPDDKARTVERLAKERGMEDPAKRIEAMITDHKVMLFMKGNKMFPQCGFSNTAVNLLKTITNDFETFDVHSFVASCALRHPSTCTCACVRRSPQVLSDESIREGVKKYSAWPTIPQCYIDGEFVGGCDILIEMHESGELKEMVEKALALKT